MSSPYKIRIFGDPVLKKVATEVTDIDSALVRLTEDMLATMYEAPGIGLAAPQVGVGKRLFVYDLGEGPQVLINPEIRESAGEWAFDEGCLSVPELSFEIIRPKEIHLVGRDIDGNEVDVEADEIFARLIQHELDHLNGVLLLEHLESDERKQALRVLRERALALSDPASGDPNASATSGSGLGSGGSGDSGSGDAGPGVATNGLSLP